MVHRFLAVIAFCTALFITGCVPSPYYQKDHTIPGNQWSSQYKPSFKFEITDTMSAYNVYFIIRHTEAYSFSNIWMWVYTKQPGDSTFQRLRVEIPLAEPSGKWLGKGMGEIWEQRLPMTKDGAPMVFNKAGIYEMQFEQNMRVNPLPEILQIGLRLEKKDAPRQNAQQ
ncbi:MAG: gldH [Flavipsychrobacter sp.]|jgi:gliding motility-associated lipoprotein GldH|nr:gldH [Flavipsychrobacter sp.]